MLWKRLTPAFALALSAAGSYTAGPAFAQDPAAEQKKLEAMVQLGIANSRMKDFFDLQFLARSFEFDGDVLTKAIAATFKRRETAVPDDEPVAFTATFTGDAQKKAQWTGFLKRSGVADTKLDLAAVVADIRGFLLEPLEAVRAGAAFAKTWSKGVWQ